jgi:hypothetical protein
VCRATIGEQTSIRSARARPSGEGSAALLDRVLDPAVDGEADVLLYSYSALPAAAAEVPGLAVQPLPPELELEPV